MAARVLPPTHVIARYNILVAGAKLVITPCFGSIIFSNFDI